MTIDDLIAEEVSKDATLEPANKPLEVSEDGDGAIVLEPSAPRRTTPESSLAASAP